MKVDPKDKKVVLAADLLIPGVGETTGGSERISDPKEVVNESGEELDNCSKYMPCLVLAIISSRLMSPGFTTIFVGCTEGSIKYLWSTLVNASEKVGSFSPFPVGFNEAV
jgi:hypothetical protein